MTEPRPTNLMTADELFQMPDDGWKYELVRGELIRMSPSGSRSSMVGVKISARFVIFVEQHDLGFCGDADWGFRLAANPDIVRAPDVGFVSKDRIPADGIPAGYWPGAPDLAVEVLSPSDRFADVLQKVEEYLSAGTHLVWVVDPEARKAFIFRRDQAPVIVGTDGELRGEDVVPGFVLRLSEVWV